MQTHFLSKATGKGNRLDDMKNIRERAKENPKIAHGVMDVIRQNQDYTICNEDGTSGLKKFLYRTARKCVGYQESWEILLKTLYEKSGSEQEFRNFKSDLKAAVFDDDLPEYTVKWVIKGKQTSIIFRRRLKTDEIDRLIEEFELTNAMEKLSHHHSSN